MTTSKDYAYGKRDRLNMVFRRFKYLLFRFLKDRMLNSSKNVSDIQYVVFYKIESSEDYSDLLLKLSWYIPDINLLKNHVKIVGKKVNQIETPSFLMSSNTYSLPGNIEVKDIEYFKELSDKKALIVLTKFSHIFNSQILRNLTRVEIIDPYYYSYVESITWQNLFFKIINDDQKTYYKNMSLDNFASMSEKFASKKSGICFVTGPSFDNYKKYDFSGFGLKIICNSIVKNDDFLEHIGGPHMLVFADPVFHFGASKYADSFRQCVLNVVRKYKCYVFVPIAALPLMLKMDESLTDYFIGIDYDNKDYNFPTEDKFFVKDNGNILTNLMIPLASAFTDDIYIFGADGRKKDEKYFWTHSKTAQFNDLMNSAFETHPSFFRDRDYSDYYDRHCATVQELFNYGERSGKKYYSLTPSFIPALHAREILTPTHSID